MLRFDSDDEFRVEGLFRGSRERQEAAARMLLWHLPRDLICARTLHRLLHAFRDCRALNGMKVDVAIKHAGLRRPERR